jgi:hypothetical protein
MTTQDLKNNKAEIIAKYKSLGGIDSMLSEFMGTLLQAVEFGLNETEDAILLVDQFYNTRYAGVAQKQNLRETMGAIAERNGGRYNTIGQFQKY